MTAINVTGLASTIRGLDYLGQTVFKRAGSDALSNVAFIIARQEMPKEVRDSFEGFRRITETAFLSQRASFKKDPIQAVVFIKEAQNQDKFLAPNILGGTRGAGDYGALKRGGVLLPVEAPLDSAGNFPSSQRFLGRAGTRRGKGSGDKSEFVGIPKGRPNNFEKYFGVWRRNGPRDSLTLLAAFRDSVNHTKDTLDLFGTAQRTFDDLFQKDFEQKLTVEFKNLPPGWSS